MASNLQTNKIIIKTNTYPKINNIIPTIANAGEDIHISTNNNTTILSIKPVNVLACIKQFKEDTRLFLESSTPEDRELYFVKYKDLAKISLEIGIQIHELFDILLEVPLHHEQITIQYSIPSVPALPPIQAADSISLSQIVEPEFIAEWQGVKLFVPPSQENLFFTIGEKINRIFQAYQVKFPRSALIFMLALGGFYGFAKWYAYHTYGDERTINPINLLSDVIGNKVYSEKRQLTESEYYNELINVVKNFESTVNGSGLRQELGFRIIVGDGKEYSSKNGFIETEVQSETGRLRYLLDCFGSGVGLVILVCFGGCILYIVKLLFDSKADEKELRRKLQNKNDLLLETEVKLSIERTFGGILVDMLKQALFHQTDSNAHQATAPTDENTLQTELLTNTPHSTMPLPEGNSSYPATPIREAPPPTLHGYPTRVKINSKIMNCPITGEQSSKCTEPCCKNTEMFSVIQEDSNEPGGWKFIEYLEVRKAPRMATPVGGWNVKSLRSRFIGV